MHRDASSAQPEPLPLPLLPIFLIVLVDVLGLTIVFPLLPLYGESFGASAFVAALLVPAYSVCQMFASPVLGKLSDRFGRRRVLVASQTGTLLGFLLIAGAPALWVVFAGRILDGLTAGNLTVAQAYIADNTAPKDRARSFALIGIAFGVGFMLGPAGGGYLSRYGLSVPLFAAAGLSALSIVCTLTLLPEERVTAKSQPPNGAQPTGTFVGDEALAPAGRRLGVLDFGAYVQYFQRPVLRGLLLQFFLYLFAFAMFMSGFALFAERRFFWHGAHFTAHEIGWVFALGGLVGVVIQGGLLGKLVNRFGERPLISLGMVALGTGYAALAYVQPVASLVGATVLAAMGNALLRPNLTSLITRAVTRHEQGVVLGLTQSLASLSTIAAAPISGWLIENGHLDAWSCVAGATCFVALAVGHFSGAQQRGAALA